MNTKVDLILKQKFRKVQVCNEFPFFPLDRNDIVKSCDSSCFWFIVERLITTENKNHTKTG